MSTVGMPDPMARRVGYCIKRAQSALRTRLDEVLRPLDLTAPQYAVLAAIELEPGISNAALARAAFVTPQTMQAIVANLERARLLVREADPMHGRVLKGELTANGRKRLTKAHILTAGVESAMLGPLSSGDAGKMAAWLRQCADNLQTQRAIAKKPTRKAG
jgi:DNA-binding MarR family transcriptional regulator